MQQEAKQKLADRLSGGAGQRDVGGSAARSQPQPPSPPAEGEPATSAGSDSAAAAAAAGSAPVLEVIVPVVLAPPSSGQDAQSGQPTVAADARSVDAADADGDERLQQAELEAQLNWERLQRRWRHFLERPLAPVPPELQSPELQGGGGTGRRSSTRATLTPDEELQGGSSAGQQGGQEEGEATDEEEQQQPMRQLACRALQAALLAVFAAQWAPVVGAVVGGALPLGRDTMLAFLLACPPTPLTEAWQMVGRCAGFHCSKGRAGAGWVAAAWVGGWAGGRGGRGGGAAGQPVRVLMPGGWDMDGGLDRPVVLICTGVGGLPGGLPSVLPQLPHQAPRSEPSYA